MKIVDKNLDIALHIQLYQIIKDMIESKELEEGASLMPERELCKLQNISRMTVNKAIINLEDKVRELLYHIKNNSIDFKS